MIDKVQKIKQRISREKDGLMDAQGNFEYPEHEGAYHILCNLDAYIDSLQEEPVSDDFEMALAEMIDKAQTSVVEPWVITAQWKDELIKLAKSEEPISEDLEKEMDSYFMKMQVHKNENIFETSFKDIARHFVNWQKNHLWKPADGDDLPEIDREVIALTQPYPLGGNEYVVSFAHRPNPNGWDGKSVITGKTVHYTPKTYGEGGWNIPNIVYWLDVELPKE